MSKPPWWARVVLWMFGFKCEYVNPDELRFYKRIKAYF